MRNNLRIVEIWETSKKYGQANICSIDNKILIFKNSLFSWSEKFSINYSGGTDKDTKKAQPSNICITGNAQNIRPHPL